MHCVDRVSFKDSVDFTIYELMAIYWPSPPSGVEAPFSSGVAPSSPSVIGVVGVAPSSLKIIMRITRYKLILGDLSLITGYSE